MLVDILLDACGQSPSRLAVSDGRRALTFRRLKALAVAIRGVVGKLSTNERIGVMLPASTAFPATLFGILWARRTVVPLNFLLTHEELGHVVRDAGLDVILTIKPFAELVQKLPARAIYLEDLSLPRRLIWASIRPTPKPPQVDRDETAVLLYTSGTTGTPKGVELTYGNLYSNCCDAIASLEIESNHTFLNVLPPFHVFGLTAMVLVPVALCSTVIAIPRFSPVAMMRALREHEITVMMAIPSMYAALLRAKSADASMFRAIYLAISGGEPLPDGIRRGFQERFGVELREGYGLTETSPVVACNSVRYSRAGSVGKPIRNTEVRIVGPEGEVMPAGEDGEVLIRGPGVMKGYYKRPEETRAVIDDEGFLHTGDIGHMDADGFLTLTGRAKDMLIIGGENVFPIEIEEVLDTHPAVVHSAVIGVADDSRGEVPVAFVVPNGEQEVSEQELRNFVRQSLPGFKVPRRIILREDLPTGPTGKILKRKLHELL